MTINKQEEFTMNNNNTIQTPFSWSAVFGGLFAATSIGALFALLGLAIGLAFLKADSDVIGSLSTGSIIWFIVGGTMAMFIGGVVTGYLAPTNQAFKTMIHGFVMWSVSFILSLMLTLNGLGAVVTGSGQLIGQVLTISGKAMSSTLSPVMDQVADSLNISENKSLQKITKQIGTMVSDNAKKAAKQGKEKIMQATSSDDMQDQLVESVKNFVTNTNDDARDELHDKAINQVMKAGDLTHDQAEKLVDKWQELYQKAADKAQEKAAQMKDQAKEAVNNTSNVLSAVTFYAFIAMLLGAIATVFGSRVGLGWQQNKK